MNWKNLAFILALLLLVGSASAWLDGYQYRKSHQITGSSSGTLTDYPVVLIFYNTEGTDSGNNCYLGSQVAQADLDDIRITAEDGTILNYWVGIREPTYVIMYAKIPSIPPSGTTIYAYYGNDTVNSDSNGEATFLLFDHFDGGSINTSKWTVTGTLTVSNSIVTLNGGTTEAVQSLQTFGIGTSTYANGSMVNTVSGNLIGFQQGTTSTTNIALFRTTNPNYVVRNSAGTTTTDFSLGSAYTGYHVWTIKRRSTTQNDYLIDGSLVRTATTGVTTANLPVRLSSAANTFVYVDYVFVTKLANPEPGHGSWGPEEQNVFDITASMLPLVINQAFVDANGYNYRLAESWTGSGSDEWGIGIDVPGVTLDGNNQTLTGTTDPVNETTGVAVFADNVVVEYLNSSGWDYGIYIQNTHGGGVGWSDFSNNAHSGILLHSCGDLLILDASGTGNGQFGMWAGHSNNITLDGVTFSQNPIGILYLNMTDSRIQHYSLSDWFQSGILVLNSAQVLIGDDEVQVAGEGEVSITENAVNGLEIEDSSYIEVRGIWIDGPPVGIQVGNTTDLVIAGTSISNSPERGIGLFSCTNVTLEGNSIAGLDDDVIPDSCGIVADNSTTVDVLSNQVTRYSGGIWFDNTTGTMIGNNATGNMNIGLGAIHSPGILIADNTAESTSGGVDNMGISILSSDSFEVSRNIASGNGQCGINAAESSNGLITRNVVTGNALMGINLYQCSGINIEENNATENAGAVGIMAANSSDISIGNNTAAKNSLGIWLHNTNSSLVLANTALENTDVGIGVVSDIPPFVASVTLATNWVEGNGNCGLVIDNVTQVSVYDNYLDNINNACFGSSLITWNTTKIAVQNIVGGPFMGGNYWAQPDGQGFSQTQPDIDQDGICDGPFEMGPEDIDYLPLGGRFMVYVSFTADPTNGVLVGGQPVEVTFTDTSTGNPDQWLWNFDDGTTSTEQNPVHAFTDPRLYWVNLHASNSETGESGDWGQPIYIRPEIANGVMIWQGWNFISVPRTLEPGYDTAAIFQGIETAGHSIYRYNAATGLWEDVGLDDKLNPMEGYWIFSSQNGPYIEYHYSAGVRGVPPMKDLAPGWNAIGMGNVKPMDTEEYLASLGDTWVYLIEFDNTLQMYVDSQIHGKKTWTMWPGSGYWIYMKEGGTIMALSG